MKKSLILITLMCVLFIGGCGVKKDQKESLMEKYATDYYKNYMKDYVIGTDKVEITIEMLENANKNADSDYDLSKLKDCKKTSSATFTLNDDNDIEKAKIELKCE